MTPSHILDIATDSSAVKLLHDLTDDNIIMYICHVSSIYCLPAHTKAACKCVVHVNAQIHDDTLHVSEYMKTMCVE